MEIVQSFKREGMMDLIRKRFFSGKNILNLNKIFEIIFDEYLSCNFTHLNNFDKSVIEMLTKLNKILTLQFSYNVMNLNFPSDVIFYHKAKLSQFLISGEFKKDFIIPTYNDFKKYKINEGYMCHYCYSEDEDINSILAGISTNLNKSTEFVIRDLKKYFHTDFQAHHISNVDSLYDFFTILDTNDNKHKTIIYKLTPVKYVGFNDIKLAWGYDLFSACFYHNDTIKEMYNKYDNHAVIYKVTINILKDTTIFAKDNDIVVFYKSINDITDVIKKPFIKKNKKSKKSKSKKIIKQLTTHNELTNNIPILDNNNNTDGIDDIPILDDNDTDDTDDTDDELANINELVTPNELANDDELVTPNELANDGEFIINFNKYKLTFNNKHNFKNKNLIKQMLQDYYSTNINFRTFLTNYTNISIIQDIHNSNLHFILNHFNIVFANKFTNNISSVYHANLKQQQIQTITQVICI